MKNNFILVTGSNGVIGTALVAELKAHETQTVIPITSNDVDLRNFGATLDFFKKYKPAVVYHLAARVSGIMGNMKGQGIAFLDNTLINTNVIEAARLVDAKKIIAMGSAAIYSDNVSLPMREEDVWLGPPHYSEFGYAHAKRGMLAQLESYHQQYGMDYAYCISTNLFGINDRFDEQHGHVLPSLISKFHHADHTDGIVSVWGSGTPLRDFLYAKDAAKAMRLIAEKYTGAINLATGNTVSISETVETLRNIVNLNIKINWDRTKPDGQSLRAYDISKLRTLGFEPNYNFVDALAETYHWYSKSIKHVRR